MSYTCPHCDKEVTIDIRAKQYECPFCLGQFHIKPRTFAEVANLAIRNVAVWSVLAIRNVVLAIPNVCDFVYDLHKYALLLLFYVFTFPVGLIAVLVYKHYKNVDTIAKNSEIMARQFKD